MKVNIDGSKHIHGPNTRQNLTGLEQAQTNSAVERHLANVVTEPILKQLASGFEEITKEIKSVIDDTATTNKTDNNMFFNFVTDYGKDRAHYYNEHHSLLKALVSQLTEKGMVSAADLYKKQSEANVEK